MRKWGRKSLKEEKAIKSSIMSSTVAAGAQSCWGPLRNHEEHGFLRIFNRKATVNFHYLSVAGCPEGCNHPLPQHTLGCSCVQLGTFSWCQGKPSWREGERRRSLKCMLETVHCGSQWTWAWGHTTSACSEFVPVCLFDLILECKPYDGNHYVSLCSVELPRSRRVFYILVLN